jgi:hypothetical protein
MKKEELERKEAELREEQIKLNKVDESRVKLLM